MSDALKKVDGVELVQIKLNSGKALLDLKPANTVTLQSLNKAVASRGFEPGPASVILKGVIQEDRGKITCKILGTEDHYEVISPEPSYPQTPLWIEGTATITESSATLTILKTQDAETDRPPLRIRDLVVAPQKKQ